MFKYLFMIFLGFMLHKGAEETYDYYWSKAFASDVCMQVYVTAIDQKEEAPLSKRFQCTKKEMGKAHLLSYILMRPHFTDNEQQGKWYY